MTGNNHSKLRTSLLATVIASAVAAPAAMAAGGQLEARPVARPAAAAEAGSRLIVTYRDARATTATKLRAVNAAAGRAHGERMIRTAADARAVAPTATHMRKLAVGADLIRLSRNVDRAQLDALVRELAADPAVASVEVDELLRHTGTARVLTDVQPQLVPNDQYYAQYNWHLQNTAGGIHAPSAWDVSTGEGVVVAVLDTGIVDHPDMDANMLPGYDFITDAWVSRRATDARVPGAHDYGDWNDDPLECDVSDSSFHGTHVAGTVAELTNNGIGMAGVAHNAKVLPVRVLGRCGGYTSDIADAIVWAAGGDVPGVPANTSPAEIINMSLGGGAACRDITQTAINQAVALGTTVVVAAGNSNADASNFTPASCNNVISVAAGRITGGRASYSNYGAKIDLTAPGGGGSVDGNPGGYVWQAGNSSATAPELGNPTYYGMGGTSMAAPHVAGVAALVQSALAAAERPLLTPAELEALLVGTTRAFPATPDRPIGSGLLDAPGALDKALEVPCEVDCEPDAIELQNRVAVGGQSGGTGSATLYSIDVPAGQASLSAMTYGGSGNVSVYVSAGEPPTSTAYDARSARPGNTETARINKPAAGTYYILVVGESAYSGVTIQARY